MEMISKAIVSGSLQSLAGMDPPPEQPAVTKDTDGPFRGFLNSGPNRSERRKAKAKKRKQTKKSRA